ncbi:MAG: hypothetical protein AAF211_15550 [Myxococcota bacterium]
MAEDNGSDSTLDQAIELLKQLEPKDRRVAFATIKKHRHAEIENRKNKEQELPNSHFSKVHLLNRLPNPGGASYEQKVYIPELTFLGVGNQPDFGEALITFYPKDWTIELKSLKIYKDAFRDAMVSYERLANVMFEDLKEAYEPIRIRLMMRLRPRGGIASVLTIDSDWKIRGGDELFNDWGHNVDRFGFDVAGAPSLS